MLVQAVGVLAPRPGCEVDRPRAEPFRLGDRGFGEGPSHATPACSFVHHHVVDPRPDARGEREGDQRRHAQDRPRGIAGDQHRVRLVRHDAREVVSRRHRRTGELGQQSGDGFDELVGDSLESVNTNGELRHRGIVRRSCGALLRRPHVAFGLAAVDLSRPGDLLLLVEQPLLPLGKPAGGAPDGE